MSEFIQLHFLTAYPPANLNRDDSGRPKTAMFGGTQRLRISSQSLKRAWRTSDIMAQALEGHIGTRTKDLGNKVYPILAKGLGAKKADEVATRIAEQFGKLKLVKAFGEKKEKPKDAEEGADREGRQIEQLVHLSPAEWGAVMAFAKKVAQDKKEPTDAQYAALLTDGKGAADIALFGRMLAANPASNVEAAAQVAHALSVNRVTVEDDFFTAVDDLNDGSEDLGAGHMGTTEFAAGLFYEYVCIDRTLLTENLGGNNALTEKTLRTLAEVCLTVGPSGKQATFASRARASFALVERGDQQPRSLCAAFLKAIDGDDHLALAINSLKSTSEKIDKVYGACARERYLLDTSSGEGTLQGLVDFVARG